MSILVGDMTMYSYSNLLTFDLSSKKKIHKRKLNKTNKKEKEKEMINK